MIIELEKNIDYKSYEEFIKKNKNTSFYHSVKYLNFLENILRSKANFIVAKEKNEIIGIMPLFVKEGVHGKVVNSLPFFGSYGGVISENIEGEKKILEFLNNFNVKHDVLSSVIITNPFVKNNEIYDKFYKFNTKEERLVQCLNLKNKSAQDLWDEFEQRVRRAIRKSQKNSVEVRRHNINDDHLDEFYQIHKADMESKNGRAKPPEFFRYLKYNFVQSEDYDIFLATKEGQTIAYLLVFYFHPFTEYYMPAYKPDSKHLQSTSLLIWESMKISVEKKMELYNFGGTWKSQNELYMFKKGWNAESHYYNYYVYRNLSQINAIGIDEIKKHYQNFYVISYDEIK